MKRSGFATRWCPVAIPIPPYKSLCYNGRTRKWLRNLSAAAVDRGRRTEPSTTQRLRRLKEPPDEGRQVVGRARLALPNDQHAPTGPGELPTGLVVALDVAGQLRQPVCTIGRGLLGAKAAVV